ncbi:MAG: methyltransferase domain-containing protein [Bacteroidales bacterium]|nr:methyltransferase domain-containing protein [Bacteroidales bacterium]
MLGENLFSFSKNLYWFIKTHTISKYTLRINGLGKTHKCYICGETFFHFSKYQNGLLGLSDLILKLNLVGSDVENFGCDFCGVDDRQRHLFMFFDKLNIWEKFRNNKILHFAPQEFKLSEKIEKLNPREYIKADLFSNDPKIKKIDATRIPFDNNTFDVIICCHVLEHINNYKDAISEIHRVLNINGIAILQTPYSKLLSNNFEDPNINSDDLRLFFYGNNDHCRVLSENVFFKDLQDAGFLLQIARNSDYFSDDDSNYFGVNKNEDLIRVTKIN